MSIVDLINYMHSLIVTEIIVSLIVATSIPEVKYEEQPAKI